MFSAAIANTRGMNSPRTPLSDTDRTLVDAWLDNQWLERGLPFNEGDVDGGMVDFDNDGRLDLYVSNMYSRAGRRITASLAGLDPRMAKAARGNTLFRNLGDHFERVSGLTPPAHLVERAGWSWGGQLADLDNDGRDDLYVLSGYYTAPMEEALATDRFGEAERSTVASGGRRPVEPDRPQAEISAAPAMVRNQVET